MDPKAKALSDLSSQADALLFSMLLISIPRKHMCHLQHLPVRFYFYILKRKRVSNLGYGSTVTGMQTRIHPPFL